MKLTGDWSMAKTILASGAELSKAIDYAVQMEAQDARKKIIKGIRDQAPGGRKFAPLSPMTLAMRKLRGFRGSKALVESGALIGSITVVRKSKGKWFVGVLRSARAKDGKSLVNVARVHELGAVIVLRVSPKMRTFLMASMRRANLGGSKKGAGFIGGQLSRGIIVIKIPARPFIGPVIDKIAKDRAGLQKRLAQRIARKMNFKLGTA